MNWIIAFVTSLMLGWVGSGPAGAAPPKIELQPQTGVPGATVSIVGKGLGPFKSAQVNRVLFAGVPALIQRWDQDVVEVKVPSKAQSGPVEVLIGKKKVQAGTFSVVYPKILSIHPPSIEPGHPRRIHLHTRAGACRAGFSPLSAGP